MPKHVFVMTPPQAPAGALFTGPGELPGAPPPSPNGRVLYETLGIRIDGEGVWHYHGSPIRRKELICLFAAALRRDTQGRYWLVTPAEIGPVEVEDAPFVAVELFVGGRGETQTISFRTNVDEIVTVDAEHPLFSADREHCREAVPYVLLDRRLEARLSRPVYYELAELGEEMEIDGRRCMAVRSCGALFPLGWLDEAS
jgi:hypothetical protein